MRVLGGLEAVGRALPPAPNLLLLGASGKGWEELGVTGGVSPKTRSRHRPDGLTELYLARNYIQGRSSLRYWLAVYGTNAILTQDG